MPPDDVDARAAYATWLAESDPHTPRQQPIIEELLAEHHVMAAVLLAMEEEARELKGGGVLRPSVWALVVDFNGNFVHLCHRVKEEGHLIPAMTAAGLLDQTLIDTIREEHKLARSFTLDIRDGVDAGDWEKVLRVVSHYVHFLRPHMHNEVTNLFAVAQSLPPQTQVELRTAFEAVDSDALGTAGRQRYADVARQLCDATGVQHSL